MAQFRIAVEAGTKEGSRFFHINDGYHYHENRREQGSVYYKCVYYERGCRGRATYDGVDGFVHTQQHNHPRDLQYCDEMALRRAILERCRQLEYTPFRTILDEEWRRFAPEVVRRVTYPRMRTPMRNARMSRFPQPSPADLRALTDMLLDPQYRVLTMTEDGTDNIYGGSVTDASGDHHVLFVSQRQLNLMREQHILQSDGTFKTVPVSPEYASQVFCLVATWEHNILMLGVALMENRTEVGYRAVLELLRHLAGPDMAFVRVITDFETAQQNAWEAVFQVIVQGCLWHLARSDLDKARELHMLVHIRRIPEVRAIFRMTIALALLPEDLIVRGYYIILRHARAEGRYIYRIVHEYLRYVWTSWVSRPWRRRRMCVHASLSRTNNACEALNKMILDLVGVHPNIYRFHSGIVTLEQRMFHVADVLDHGGQPNRARKMSSVINDNNIIRLTGQLRRPPGLPQDRAIFRFLREASHLMDNDYPSKVVFCVSIEEEKRFRACPCDPA